MTSLAADEIAIAGQRRGAPWSTRIAMAVILLMVLAAVLAPLLAPQNPNFGDLGASLSPPSPQHLLGTDGAGRDTLARLLYGARLSLLGPLLVVALAALIGVPLGIAAGFAGGWLDACLSRVFDVLFAFPALLLAAVIVATFGPGFQTIVVAVTVIYVPLMARVVRAATLVERQKAYIDAMIVQGFSPLRIGARHILPNVAALVVGQTALYYGYALLDLAGLSFLGFGVQPPTPDWGSMLWYANQQVFILPTGVAAPAVAIVVAVVAFNLLGDWLSERS